MTQNDGKILMVDDDEDVLQAARLFLKEHLSVVCTETNPERVPRLLAKQDFDCILLDMNFARGMSSGQEGFHWLGKILEIDPSSVVILITAFGDVEMAVRAIKEGATDFVLKPWQNEKLLATVSAGISLRRSRAEAASMRSRGIQLAADLDQRFRDFVGVSEAMRGVFGAIEKVAATEANVLILGENGTGKELVARETHRQSGRAAEVFVSVDMGAITESLFESELFGHMRGAFTDAREERAGRFEIASGGTLFLDEIANLPSQLQAKLLSVIENRTITRIGANAATPIDIRLICATNMPIYDMVAENRFRQDLLYRINTVEISIPPLRDRPDDIPPLVDHFLGLYNRKYLKKVGGMGQSTMKKLQKYGWPGNVRELQHAVERAVIMSDSDRLRLDDFLLASSQSSRKSMMFDSFNLTEVEKEVIRRALSRHAGNVSRAAEELGLTRASLYRRMQKYDL
jgi:DNA-binding NtrC family response regulator